MSMSETFAYVTECECALQDDTNEQSVFQDKSKILVVFIKHHAIETYPCTYLRTTS
jgi:hypothetical protein